MNVIEHAMGADDTIVKAARVSYLNDDKNVDTERNIKLIQYLLKHKHASPFEHCIIAINSDYYFKYLESKHVYNPIIQVYHTQNNLTFMTLRTLFNLNDIYLLEQVQYYFPATLKLFAQLYIDENLRYKFNIEMTFSYNINDPVLIHESEYGKVILVDKLELDTHMDYYTFIIECPIFTARQWMRHRFGSYNEVSRRYTSENIYFYTPKKIRIQDTKNKQGSINTEIDQNLNNELIVRIADHNFNSGALYNKLLQHNVARELARSVLPMSLFTKFYWTVPRIALDNFITLRTDKHAQEEIRVLAQAIKDYVGYKGTDKQYCIL